MKNLSIEKNKSKKGGYTLVELMVVVGIFSLLTSIVLFNQAKLNSTILVTNLAYEVGLTVRQAQTYGISVSAANPTGGQFSGAYGLYFASSSPSQIFLFNDANGDGFRTSSAEDVSVYTIQNQRGNGVAALCIDPVAGSKCPGSSALVSNVNIVFKRPNPEALLTYTNGSGTHYVQQGLVQIVLNTPQGDDCRSVFVYQTGAVSVDNTQSLCR